MKKLTKSSLAQMAALLPELDAEDQRCILGGTATTTIPPGYTGTVPEPTTTVATTVDPYAVTGSMPTATTTSTIPTTTTACQSTSTNESGVYTSSITGIRIDYTRAYSSVMDFYQQACGGDASMFCLDSNQNIEDQMIQMFYNDKNKYYQNIQSQNGPRPVNTNTPGCIAVGAAAEGLYALVATGMEAAREAGDALGRWIDEGGLTKISEELNNMEAQLSVGIMVGIAYLFGQDTANPWGVVDERAELSCGTTTEPFYEIDPFDNDNKFPQGGSGSEFGKWMTHIGGAAVLKETFDKTIVPGNNN